ncbi:MAG: fibrobacter succinogenes major paralogous domain-containing protein [Bacteroidales bacterium]|nr:fibrobacter succinogenes major paralogous domain-containing protein [Bacteroidales bacterium]
MKRLFTLSILLLLALGIFAQMPKGFSYQAVVRNSNGKLVDNKQVGVRFSILQGSAEGSAVYTETQTLTTNANGLLSVAIGSGAGFDAIDWAGGSYFLKSEIDPNGGTDYTVTGVSQLLSVPYAMHAKTAESATETDPVFAATFSVGNSQEGDLMRYNAAAGKWEPFTPDFAMGGHAHSAATTTTSGFMGAADKSKLDGVAAGAEVNVNADWNATSGDAQILNKPDLTVYATKDMNNASITNLANPVNAQDAATKVYVDALESRIVELEVAAGIKVKDIDGNIYSTVTIGNQVWMKENLKVTKYNDGTAISNVTANNSWSALNTPAYCWYQNDYETYGKDLGALYNWFTVNSADNLCPSGWHVPTDAEWATLVSYLGGTEIAGGKLKTVERNGTDDYGFSAVAAGGRDDYEGGFYPLDESSFWTVTDGTDGGAWRYVMYDRNTYAIRHNAYKRKGLSVRCIKD